MLTDAQWALLEPLIEAVRSPARVPPQHLRRTISAIVWRHDNGAKWRAVPAELGPWWMAAQTFIRWSRLGVWERLLTLVQEQGVQLGMTFLDGTSIRVGVDGPHGIMCQDWSCHSVQQRSRPPWSLSALPSTRPSPSSPCTELMSTVARSFAKI